LRGATQPLVLDPDQPEEIQQWAAARAVGAHLKPALLGRLGLDTAEGRGLGGASLPNRVAERLLTPTAWFASDSASFGYELPKLKWRYRTAGSELIAARWLDLPEPCLVTVYDGERVVRRRSNAWRVTRQPSASEQQCRRAVAASGRPQTVVQGGWTVRGWAVADPVPRIILRSVVDEEALREPAEE
jgi:hypothetical protein